MAKFDSIFSNTETKKVDLHPKRVTKWLHYTKLIDNADQYCDETSNSEIEALADLIEADGEVLQDVLVRKTDADQYEIIAGHKRRRACKLLAEVRGKEEYAFLPCIVKNVSDVRAKFQVFSSNGHHQKTQYEIMHELEQMRYLIETYPEEFPHLQKGRMVERLAKQLGMKKSTVGEYQTISKNLGNKAMEAFKEGTLKKGAATELASFPEEQQEELIEQGIVAQKELQKIKESRQKNPCTCSAQAHVVIEDLEKTEHIEGQLVISDVDMNTKEEMVEEPDSSVVNNGFPVMKNAEERRTFLEGYQQWPVWCENLCAKEVFYRYDLPDSSFIVVRHYQKQDRWSDKMRVGKDFYLMVKNQDYLHGNESCLTEIIEHLKKVGKGVVIHE